MIICNIFVAILTRYWDTVLEMSWPRFTYVVELNVDSVRNTDPQRLGVIDIRPHYVSTASNYSLHFYRLRRTPCNKKSLYTLALRMIMFIYFIRDLSQTCDMRRFLYESLEV